MECGVPDGLGHVMQTCPALHGLRVKRHDAIVTLVEKRLAEGGTVIVKRETRITGVNNLMIPDLVVVKESMACVLDVQVVSDAGVKSLAEFHRWKRDKYNNSSVLRYCHTLASIDQVIFMPVTISWRGLLYLESAKKLKELFNVSEQFLKLLVVRSLEGSIKMFGQYRRYSAGGGMNGRRGS